jgi:hypothetical protein
MTIEAENTNFKLKNAWKFTTKVGKNSKHPGWFFGRVLFSMFTKKKSHEKSVGRKKKIN